MKKAVIVITALSVIICLSACSFGSGKDVPDHTPKIDQNVTVEQSLRENWIWDEFSADNLEYTVFPTWKDGKQTDYKYALISAKKPDKTNRMNVAVVFFKDSEEHGDDYDYILSCSGVCEGADPEGLRNGDSFIFGPYPIAGPNGDYRDICVGYSENGWFLVNDEKVACEENGVIAYVTEHGYEIQFGNFRPKE